MIIALASAAAVVADILSRAEGSRQTGMLIRRAHQTCPAPQGVTPRLRVVLASLDGRDVRPTPQVYHEAAEALLSAAGADPVAFLLRDLATCGWGSSSGISSLLEDLPPSARRLLEESGFVIIDHYDFWQARSDKWLIVAEGWRTDCLWDGYGPWSDEWVSLHGPAGSGPQALFSDLGELSEVGDERLIGVMAAEAQLRRAHLPVGGTPDSAPAGADLVAEVWAKSSDSDLRAGGYLFTQLTLWRLRA